MKNLHRGLLLLAGLSAACDEAASPTGPIPGDKRTGEEIYLAECAVCHGADGLGGTGPNLFELVPMLRDETISTVIEDGKGNMPAKDLEKEELTLLLAYLRDKFGAFQEPMPMMMERDGAAIYAAECAGCHGADGMGGRLAPSLFERVPPRTDDALKLVVTMGSGNMRPRNVAEPELTVLIAYLRLTFGAYVPPVAGMEGRALYDAECARCHGMDGTGGMRAPGLTDRVPHLSNPFLTQTITVGSGNMRARTVSPEQLTQLLPFLRTLAGEYSHGSPDVPISAAGGVDAYFGRCGRCHGADGLGVMGEPSLVERVPLLSNARLVRAMTEGAAHTSPSAIAEPELTPVVAYLRTTFGEYAPPRPPMMGDGGMGMGGADGGPTEDGGPVVVDGGTPVAQDGGVVVASDAGTAPDATPGADAAALPDAALLPDAAPAVDAAAPDATPGADAGTAPDAAIGVDAGAPVADGGTTPPDAGTPSSVVVHPTCGNTVTDGLEICDGTTWSTSYPGPDCGDFALGTGTAGCAASCYPDFSTCSTADLCTAQLWYNDGWCDACELLGGVADAECATVCDLDGFCADYFDALTGQWTCQARGFVDPDCGICGDGLLDDDELCDGSDLGGFDCTDYGYSSGTLACTSTCLPDLSGCTALLCTDTCTWAGDGECDDGGPGSDYSVCALGTDCADCGPR